MCETLYNYTQSCAIVQLQGSVLAWQKSHTQYLNSTPPAILLWGTLLNNRMVRLYPSPGTSPHWGLPLPPKGPTTVSQCEINKYQGQIILHRPKYFKETFCLFLGDYLKKQKIIVDHSNYD